MSKLAREHVTVCLSGDGGDELFCGYNRYLHSERTWALARVLPARVRKALGDQLAAVSPGTWDRMATCFAVRVPRVGYKVHKLASALRAANLTDVYRDLISYWKAPDAISRRDCGNSFYRFPPPQINHHIETVKTDDLHICRSYFPTTIAQQRSDLNERHIFA
ncbi:hypothetical protein C2W62_44275 [Candidatus Entotheonella serta]|nr:hypothetical protein C2W62_44275 [Candidatus Entotheonella serta]